MMRTLSGRFLLAIIFGTALAVACASPEAEYEERDETAVERGLFDEQKTVTLTGCLRAAEGTVTERTPKPEPARPTGRTGAQRFVLEVMAAPGERPERAEPGRPGAATGKYELMAAADVKLAEHVGHLVRIEGRVSDPRAWERGEFETERQTPRTEPRQPEGQQPPRTTPEQPRPTPGETRTTAEYPTLMVESIEMVAATCQSPRTSQ